MPAPESWQVIEAVAERLRVITIAGGFRTDAGLDVVTEHAELKTDSPTPQLLVFADGEVRLAASSSRKWRDYILGVVVQCRFQQAQQRAQRQAHEVMADLDRAIPADAAKLTNAEWKIEQTGLVIAQRPLGASTTVVQLSLDVSYRVETPTA